MAAAAAADSADEADIALFCELLAFETVSFEGPASGAYRACAQWLVETLDGRLGLETQVGNLVVMVSFDKRAKYPHPHARVGVALTNKYVAKSNQNR